MLRLENDQLQVSILHPVHDRARLGSRYCTGGYIYEVSDRRLGILTSGPGYPNEDPPPVFDGQGMPEAFPSFLWPGAASATRDSPPAVGTKMLVIGVGFVRSTDLEHFRVMPVDEFCEWNVTQLPTVVTMETTQEFGAWSLRLTRHVRLLNRMIVSETRLANVGTDRVAFRWFPHPFFPIPSGECCKYNVTVRVADNVGYELRDNGWIATKIDRPWPRAGHYLALNSDSADHLVVLQRHPKLGTVVATCSYSATLLPIWGNTNTFSFEPYLTETAEPGSEKRWSIAYDF